MADELRIIQKGDFVGFSDGESIIWHHKPALLAATDHLPAFPQDEEPPVNFGCRCVLDVATTVSDLANRPQEMWRATLMKRELGISTAPGTYDSPALDAPVIIDMASSIALEFVPEDGLVDLEACEEPVLGEKRWLVCRVSATRPAD